MSKKILCVGDSFTSGYELLDPSTQSWPALLANNTNWDVTNAGVGGGSLDRCIRILFEHIDNYDFIIFGCPPWIRQETYLLSVNKPIEIGVHKKLVTIPWEKDFYKFSYNDLFYYKKWLMNIIAVQSLLKQYNKKYMFHVTYQLIAKEYKDKCKNLLDKIDFQYFLEEGKSLYDLTSSFPRGPEHHPLSEGHQYLFDIIQKKINHQMLT